MTARRLAPALATALVAAALAAGALAQGSSASVRDPGRPPQADIDAALAARGVRDAAPAGGRAGVDAQAEDRLRESFEAADRARRGLLTRQEARAGGFAWIANHFDAIDTRHAGEVGFADVLRYLHATRRGLAASSSGR